MVPLMEVLMTYLGTSLLSVALVGGSISVPCLAYLLFPSLKETIQQLKTAGDHVLYKNYLRFCSHNK